MISARNLLLSLPINLVYLRQLTPSLFKKKKKRSKKWEKETSHLDQAVNLKKHS
jgi:hypothetical protein